MANREIPMNCLGEETRCLVYSGDNIPDLDIKTGDSLNYVLGQLAQTPQAVAETAGIYINTFSIPVLSSCAIKLVGYSFEYTISASASGILFSWDIYNNLPAGFGYTSTTVEAIADGRVASSSSRSSSLSVSASKLPAVIKINQLVNTPCGDIALTKSIPITASLRGSYTGVFEVNDLNNTPSELTIEQAIDMAIAMGIQNQQQIEDFRAVQSISKFDSLDSRVSDLEIKEPDTTVTYLDKAVSQTKEISQALTDAFSVIRANEAMISALQNEIDALKVQITNLS